MPNETNNNPENPIESWRIRVLSLAERLAETFAQTEVGRRRVAFDDGSMMDPAFKATLGYCRRSCIMIVLNDWWASQGENRNGDLRGNTDHVEQCYRGDYMGDLTYRNLFYNRPHPRYGLPERWGHDVVERGEAVITNACLGMRLAGTSNEGRLSDEEYAAGYFYWWLPLARELKPNRIYLCGSWAFGAQVNGASLLEASQRQLVGVEIAHLPHPRGWIRRYPP
jgi:hypothetical protein